MRLPTRRCKGYIERQCHHISAHQRRIYVDSPTYLASFRTGYGVDGKNGIQRSRIPLKGSRDVCLFSPSATFAPDHQATNMMRTRPWTLIDLPEKKIRPVLAWKAFGPEANSEDVDKDPPADLPLVGTLNSPPVVRIYTLVSLSHSSVLLPLRCYSVAPCQSTQVTTCPP